MRSPYTSDSTRATWGRLTRDAARTSGQEASEVSVHVCMFSPNSSTVTGRVSAALTFSVIFLIGRLLPLVRLHNLNSSPENKTKTVRLMLNTWIYRKTHLMQVLRFTSSRVLSRCFTKIWIYLRETRTCRCPELSWRLPTRPTLSWRRTERPRRP